MRPLFPKDMRNDVAITMTVLAVDPDCSPEILGMIGASIAVSISDIPWNGPIGGISVGLVDGEIVLMPNLEQRGKSDLNLTVASSEKKVVMIEAGANEVPDDVMFDAIMAGHNEIVKSLIPFIKDIQAQIGKPKFAFESQEVDHDMFDAISDFAIERIRYALDTDDKNIREERLKPIVDDIHAKFDEVYPEKIAMINEAIYKLQKFVVRRWLLDDNKRVDGRKMDEIRPLAAEVGMLPRVHGSGLFTRGQTQVMTICTLGPVSDSQKLEGLDEEEGKRYMHHYNFPSYSVGETKPSRGPGRREIGHGALAERALVPVLPTEEEFPYAIRTVSETFESNGSTSQASICASTMSLMAAGVPIKKPVAGISCGLVTGETDDDYIVLTDIQGLEDFFGDMDFKVAGTHDGITAIQMDIKIHGLTRPIVEEAIRRTKEAREYILTEVMEKCIDKPRTSVGEFAPKIIQIQIDPQKIGDVVGQRGKTINTIIERTGVKIDITDDGAVSICGTDQKGMDLVAYVMDELCQDAVQIVVLGTGEERYENMFRHFDWKYHGKVSAQIYYDEAMSHRIYAASDAFLMPSLFEPCGLSQLMSLRYGTLPIVRETGGLKDTVIPYNEFEGTGTGFSFVNYNAHEMLATIRYAESVYYDKKREWNKLVDRAMAADFSWNNSARQYEEMYNWLIGE